MISQETAMKIYNCHREIETGEKLLEEIKVIIGSIKENRFAPDIKDSFGRPRKLQLGIPHGENGHRLFDISWEMAEPIINIHIVKKRAELEEISEIALLEAKTIYQPTRAT